MLCLGVGLWLEQEPQIMSYRGGGVFHKRLMQQRQEDKGSSWVGSWERGVQFRPASLRVLRCFRTMSL